MRDPKGQAPQPDGLTTASRVETVARCSPADPLLDTRRRASATTPARFPRAPPPAARRALARADRSDRAFLADKRAAAVVADLVMPNLVHHVHGKKRVRVARTWREGSVHHFVEWNVEVVIESAMAHAYKTPSNEGMTTTDTTKNQCYVVAKAMQKRCAPETYALALGKQFLDSYPLISAVEVRVEQAPWRRTKVLGADHDHGYTFTAPCLRCARRWSRGRSRRRCGAA